MAFLNVNYHSASLQKACSMQIILPEMTKEPYPIMYLLHGLSDDHTIWSRRTRIEWYVRDLPLAVVLDQISFYGYFGVQKCQLSQAEAIASALQNGKFFLELLHIWFRENSPHKYISR